MFRRGWLTILSATVLITATVALAKEKDGEHDNDGRRIQHVLLISVGGMHSLDFVNCANGPEQPTIGSHRGHSDTSCSAVHLAR